MNISLAHFNKMPSSPKTTELFARFEHFLNAILQKIFPNWYAKAAAREIKLYPIGNLNPYSFLSHRWLSLPVVLESIKKSLSEQEDDWSKLTQILDKLVREQEYTRALSILSIDGVEQCAHVQDYPSLLSYGEDNSKEVSIESAEDFDLKIYQAFPEENKPHRVVYREWDGRYYWINPVEPKLLAALQIYAQNKQRDGVFRATIHVESLNTQALERLRQNWWLVLLRREQAQTMHDLMKHAGLSVALANFEWRRDDLAFLVARKTDPKTNRILLNLLDGRSTQEVLEFGSFLSRKHYPFRAS